jgi:hypothetical protein
MLAGSPGLLTNAGIKLEPQEEVGNSLQWGLLSSAPQIAISDPVFTVSYHLLCACQSYMRKIPPDKMLQFDYACMH